jgi:hypothetical protein
VQPAGRPEVGLPCGASATVAIEHAVSRAAAQEHRRDDDEVWHFLRLL